MIYRSKYKCRIKEYDPSLKKGKSTIEYNQDGNPQYFCYGYTEASTDELLDVCRNCKNNVNYNED